MGHVIVRLKGGLGNQMFQFATGYAVAQRLGAPLLMDTSVLDRRGDDVTWTVRPYELGAFRTDVVFASAAQVAELERAGAVARVVRKVTGSERRVITESGHAWNAAVESCTAPVLLDGYWQNERYFAGHASALRERIFVPKDAISGRNAELLDAVRSCVSASLHLRRGDYASDPATRAHHGLVPLEHLMDAARWLVAERGVEHFFLFSDEPAAAATDLRLPVPVTVVAHNSGADAHWDLFLMKHARHHIIANSSFSWWGAWLNPDPHKTVIGPRQWFAHDAGASDHILPPAWLRMPIGHG